VGDELHGEWPSAETAADADPPWSPADSAGDPAFGSYGDGYLEWVADRYYWDPHEERTIADTRSLWSKRHRLVDPDAIYVELNARRNRSKNRSKAS
jgi:hypothetical protein